MVCTALVPFGLTNVVTYALRLRPELSSYKAIATPLRYTRNSDEIIVALEETRNDVVGLEHADPAEIREKLIKFEEEAAQTSP